MSKKLYIVNVNTDLVIEAENEQDVRFQTRNFIREHMMCADFDDVNFEQIKSAKDLPKGWNETCIPFGNKTDSTIGDIFKSRPKKNILKIISGNMANMVQFKIDPNRQIKVGQIAQLSTDGNQIMAVASDGTAPMGLVIKKVKVKNKKTGSISHRVKICVSKVLIETDNYETDQKYPINANVFLSKDGKYSTKQELHNHAVVGMVTMPPTASNSMLQLMIL